MSPTGKPEGKSEMEVCVIVMGAGCHSQAGQVLPVANTAIKNVYMCNRRRDMD